MGHFRIDFKIFYVFLLPRQFHIKGYYDLIMSFLYNSIQFPSNTFVLINYLFIKTKI